MEVANVRLYRDPGEQPVCGRGPSADIRCGGRGYSYVVAVFAAWCDLQDESPQAGIDDRRGRGGFAADVQHRLLSQCAYAADPGSANRIGAEAHRLFRSY